MTAIIRKSATYLSGSIFARLILFLMLPLYTRALDPSQFGRFDLIVSYLYLAITLLYFDIHHGALRFIYQAQSKNQNPYAVIQSSLPILALSSIAYIAVCLAVFPLLAPDLIPLLILFGLLNKLVDFNGTIARALNHSVTFSMSHVLHAIGLTVSTVYLLLIRGMGIEALFIAEILGFSIQLIYIEYRCRIWKGFRIKNIDWGLSAQLLRYSGPFILQVSAYWILGRLGRIAVATQLSTSANGLYATAMALTGGLSILATNILHAWQETAYSRGGSPSEKSVYFSNALLYGIALITAAYCGFLAGIRLLFPLLVGADFAAAGVYIPALLAGTAAYSMDLFTAGIFANYLDNRKVVRASLGGAILCIIITFPMVTLFGIHGTAFAVMLSFGVSIALKLHALRRHFRIDLRVLHMISLTIPALIAAYFYYSFSLLIASSGILVCLAASILLLALFRKSQCPD